MSDLCQHCHRYHCNRPRGLCTQCYKNLDVRQLYPTAKNYTVKYGLKEPTEEELETLIAEQMRNLPAWWGRESERQKQGYE